MYIAMTNTTKTTKGHESERISKRDANKHLINITVLKTLHVSEHVVGYILLISTSLNLNLLWSCRDREFFLAAVAKCLLTVGIAGSLKKIL